MRLMPGPMREVELVEVVDEPGRSRSGPPTQTWTQVEDDPADDVLAARTWLRRHARWLVASVALVVGVLAVTELVLDRREDARTAALAAVPGVVPPVDPTIGVLWRADPELALALRSGTVVDGLLVGGTQDASGAPAIVGLDPDTGRVVWRTPVELPVPASTGASAPQELWIACTPVRSDGSDLTACTAQRYGDGRRGRPGDVGLGARPGRREAAGGA